MKKIILIKYIDHIQLGHLYEHLYCMYIVNYFRKNGLFSYIDYNIDAKTYYKGYIRLEIDLYSERALIHENEIYDSKIQFEEDSVNGALLQIMAEKFADIEYLDNVVATNVLNTYQSLPWITLNDLESKNYKLKRLNNKSLRFKDRSVRQFGILKQTIAIDKKYVNTDKQKILPLFLVVSKALRNNLQESISDDSFCYTYDDKLIISEKDVKDINLYRIDRRQAVKITTELDTTIELMKNANIYGFVKHLSSFLTNASLDQPMNCPDDEEIIEKVGVLVGPKDWHQIGTEKAILELISHMTISFKLGDSTQTLRLTTTSAGHIKTDLLK